MNNAEEKWFWMMEYRHKRNMPPAQKWVWNEAKEAYEKEFNKGEKC